MSDDMGASADAGRAVAASPSSPTVSPLRASIPSAEYDAMRKLLDPMVEAAYAMPVGELVAAMRGLYATTQTNCPWYAYGLRHALPPILATIGQGKEGYEEAWLPAQAIEARRAETGTGSVVDESPVAEGHAPNPSPDNPIPEGRVK